MFISVSCSFPPPRYHPNRIHPTNSLRCNIRLRRHFLSLCGSYSCCYYWWLVVVYKRVKALGGFQGRPRQLLQPPPSPSKPPTLLQRAAAQKICTFLHIYLEYCRTYCIIAHVHKTQITAWSRKYKRMLALYRHTEVVKLWREWPTEAEAQNMTCILVIPTNTIIGDADTILRVEFKCFV